MRIVRLPRFYTWVGVVGSICFLVAPIWATISYFVWEEGALSDFIVPVVGFGAFLLLSLAIVAAGLFWKIEYDEDGFTYTTFLNHTTRYSYSDVRRVTHKKNGIIIKTNGRKLFLDTMAIGVEEFLEFRARQQ